MSLNEVVDRNRLELSPEPTEHELLERARSLLPVIRRHAERSEQDRRVVPEIVAEMRSLGLFRVLQPRRWGGYEMAPKVFTDIQIALGEADMSVGWIYGVLGCHNFQMGLFDDRAAREVWGNDSSVLIASSSYQPAGKAEPVPGGYRFTGRWKFSSGVEHCDWVFLSGMHDGDFLTCLLPRADYEIVDTWDVMGLKATGSQDIHVNDVFLPEYRIHRSSEGFLCRGPGSAVNTGWLYRIPFHQIFLRAISSSAIGALEAMVGHFEVYGRERIGLAGVPSKLDPDAQYALGNARRVIHELKAVAYANFAALTEYAVRAEVPPVEERLLYRLECASVSERCLEAARLLFEACGGRGVFRSQPFGRIYNDLVAANQHVAQQSRPVGRSLGATMLGIDTKEWYL